MNITDTVRGWAKFLHPESLKSNLILASLFLTAYESLRASIIDQCKGFYWTGFDASGDIISQNYENRVLCRHKSRLRASMLWFLEMGAIDQDDLDLLERLREHRNEIAHDLPKFITSADHDVNVELLRGLVELVTKIDRWWIKEIEIPANPDFDEADLDAIADAEIQSGRMVFLSLLLQIATRDDSESVQFYQQFMDGVETLQANAR